MQPLRHVVLLVALLASLVVPATASAAPTSVRLSAPSTAATLDLAITPDGTAVFIATVNGHDALWSRPADGSGIVTRLSGFGGHDHQVTDFVVTNDGRTVYFIGNMRYERTWDLNVVPVDGSAPATLVESPSMRESTELDLNPDGSRLLFSDRLYTLAIDAGPGTGPVRQPIAAAPHLDTDIPATDTHRLEVRRTIRAGVHTADLFTRRFDTTTSERINELEDELDGLRGVDVVPDLQRVVYGMHRRFDSDRLYVHAADGSGHECELTPPRGLIHLGDRVVTPDAREVVYVDGGKVYARPLDLSAERRRIPLPDVLGIEAQWLHLTPDGRTLVVEAFGPGRWSLYAGPLTGTTPLAPIASSDRDTRTLVVDDIRGDGTVLFRADLHDETVRSYTVDVDGSSDPVEVTEPTLTGDAGPGLFTTDGTAVVHVAPQGEPDPAVWRTTRGVPPPGPSPAPPAVVTATTPPCPPDTAPGDDTVTGDATVVSGVPADLVALPQFTPDASRVVFDREGDEEDGPGVWSAPTDGSGPAVRLSPEGRIATLFGALDGNLSPDGTRVLFTMQSEDGRQNHLWIVPVDGSRPPVQVSRGNHADARVGLYHWTADGTRAVYQGRLIDDRNVVLYSRLVDRSEPQEWLATGGPYGRLLRFDVAPNGWVVFNADLDYDFRALVYAVPADGSQPFTLLSDHSGIEEHRVATGWYEWVDGGDTVVFAGRLESEDYQFWRRPVDGSAPKTAFEVDGGSPALSPARDRFAVVSDSADQVVTLLTQPVAGGPPTTIGVLADNGFSEPPSWSADGSRVLGWGIRDGLRLLSAPGDGSGELVAVTPRTHGLPSVPMPLPDGRVLVALQPEQDGVGNPWAADVDRSRPAVQLFDRAEDQAVVWSSAGVTPDGKVLLVVEQGPDADRFGVRLVDPDAPSATVDQGVVADVVALPVAAPDGSVAAIGLADEVAPSSRLALTRRGLDPSAPQPDPTDPDPTDPDPTEAPPTDESTGEPTEEPTPPEEPSPPSESPTPVESSPTASPAPDESPTPRPSGETSSPGGGTTDPDGSVGPASVERVAAADRVGTSVAMSQRFHPDGPDTVLVATGDDHPDAVAGGPLAGALDAPVLLVRGEQLADDVVAELERLAPRRILVLGGPAAVGDAVVRELGDHAGEVRRIAGADRYATAVAIADELVRLAGRPERGGAVHLAAGRGFADALAGGAVAEGPLLLTAADGLPDATRDALRRLAPDRVVVLGGPAAIGARVDDEVADLIGRRPERVAGASRYATAASLAEAHASAELVFIATGEDFPDALAAAGVANARRAPILLVPRSSPVPDEVVAQLDRLRPRWIVVVGGPAAVPRDVLDQLRPR